MIEDYELPATGANARRITRISHLMNLPVDPAIVELSKTGHFDLETYLSTLPPKLLDAVTPQLCDIVSYAYDCNFRCITGGKTQHETFLIMMLCALAANVKPIVFYSQSKQDRIFGIVKFLKSMGIDHQVIEGDCDEISSDVLVTSYKGANQTLLQDARRGILIHQSLCDENQYGNITTPLDFLAMEFPKCIFGITRNQMMQSFEFYASSDLTWSQSQNFKLAFEALFYNNSMGKVFSSRSKAFDNSLLQLGFLMSSPEHFSKIMSINMDLHKD